MTFQPGIADLVILILLAGLTTAEVFIFARLSRDPSGTARSRTYIFFIAYQWLLAAGILALWATMNRPWSAILLGMPHPVVFALCSALAFAYLGLGISQMRLLNKPAIVEKVRSRFAELEWLTPHSPLERRLWWLAALTAGCCEELFFRGFLLALVTHYSGVIVAILVTSLLFGLYHAYFGMKGITRTGALGLLFAAIAVASGSLIPAMALHFFIDLISGEAGYRIVTSTESL
jgi:uncharacterized protein